MADGELRLKITMALPRPVLSGNFSGATTVAQTGLSRTLLGEEVALYRVADLAANCTFSGPAILEDDFYTARIDVGWTARINSPGDILLERSVS